MTHAAIAVTGERGRRIGEWRESAGNTAACRHSARAPAAQRYRSALYDSMSRIAQNVAFCGGVHRECQGRALCGGRKCVLGGPGGWHAFFIDELRDRGVKVWFRSLLSLPHLSTTTSGAP
jgi:hypothetical protein